MARQASAPGDGPVNSNAIDLTLKDGGDDEVDHYRGDQRAPTTSTTTPGEAPSGTSRPVSWSMARWRKTSAK